MELDSSPTPDAELSKPWPGQQKYVLRRYVSGTTARFGNAISSIRLICETRLKDHYDLEIVDVYQDPEATTEDQSIAGPTPAKLLPEPLCRLVGELSDRERVLSGLDIVSKAEPG
jgi:circadian clock protein KaiB